MWYSTALVCSGVVIRLFSVSTCRPSISREFTYRSITQALRQTKGQPHLPLRDILGSVSIRVFQFIGKQSDRLMSPTRNALNWILGRARAAPCGRFRSASDFGLRNPLSRSQPEAATPAVATAFRSCAESSRPTQAVFDDESARGQHVPRIARVSIRCRE